VAQIVKQHAAEFLARYEAPPHVQSTLAKLSLCRTAALGGRWYGCQACGSLCVLPNSCGDRHCPQCSGARRADWLQKTSQLLLPGVDYFQVVFTIPEKLSSLALGNRKLMFDLLFHCAWQSLQSVIEAEQEFTPAAVMVLHTWNQHLDPHVHVHAVVPGGGPSLNNDRWLVSRCRDGTTSGRWLVNAEALRAEFRRVFLERLKRLHHGGKLKLTGEWSYLSAADAFAAWLKPLEEVSWVTYIEPPVCEVSSPEHVLKYLARYLTGGPISDRRLAAYQNGRVTFWARRGQTRGGDAADIEPVTLPGHEFVCRWSQHILPSGFTKTRRYGGFSNRHRQAYLARCRELRPTSSETTSGATPEQDATASEESSTVGSDERLCCPLCAGPLRLLFSSDRPSWRIVMNGPHRPHWYRRFGYDDG